MKIEIKNCNNIDSGEINLEENKLNIKFGINGAGKSTVAKAVQYKIENEENLKNLLPFKLRKENQENFNVEVEIKGNIESVLVFDEEYVSQFLFKQDELVSNSFEVFIKTKEYIEIEEKIEAQLENIKKVFLNNEELGQVVSDFESLSKSFKTTQTSISDTSAISKALKDGNKMENIPENIKEYTPFIQDKKNCVKWLGWQTEGNTFSEGHDDCPYCVSPNDSNRKDKIKSVSENYDKNVIKNFLIIIKAVEDLGDYFSPSAKEKLNTILKKTEGLQQEEKDYLFTIKTQTDNFLQRLKNLKEISFNNLKDDDKIEEKIKSFIIDIDKWFGELKSEKTKSIVDSMNISLNKTLEEVGKLKGEIGKQKSGVKKIIEKHEKSINQFLVNAGYKYKVLISDEDGDYKIKLQHINFESDILGVNQHLSFGERNAFALVLFMFESLSKNPDLIILDDPISSFDKNKKYAILQMLFREDDSFKGKTVLMLTHDFEPVIDSIKALARKFENQTSAVFLESQQGVLTEKKIKKDNVLTFSQICENIISDKSVNIISKLIYSRRNFEILNDKGDEYQILSDLLHRRTKDGAKENRGIDDSEFETSFNNGIEKVGQIIQDFDYEKLLKIVTDKEQLKGIYNNVENSYEKLQIFRIINEDFSNSDDIGDVMKKFINETYHIENDFIHQLNPREYNLIPEYIIKECDEYINTL